MRCLLCNEINFLSKSRMLGHGTTQMRCIQPAEYLTMAGWHVRAGCVYRSIPTATKVIVFHRTLLDPHTEKYLNYAKAKGLVTIYDTDDLIFSFEGNEHLSAFSPQSKNENSDLAKQYRSFMQKCDVVTVSTTPLKRAADKFHSDVRLVRNGLAKRFQEKARSVCQKRRKGNDEWVTVGYLSGSSHHDEDFRLVEDVLLAMLQEFPKSRVLLVGKLNFSERFYEFGDRFQFQKFVLYKDFWKVFQNIDINIVPLVTSDPFVQARSEIKYMEAAIFGIPTLASPTEPYAEAIHSGINGLLVEDNEWYMSLKSLLQDKEKRIAMGEAARIDAERNYGFEARSSEWVELMSSIIQKYSASKPKDKLKIAVQYVRVLGIWSLRMLKIAKRKAIYSLQN